MNKTAFNVTPFSMLAVVAGLTASVLANPVAPMYTQTFTDAVTGDNAFTAGGFRFYTVDAGADSYQNDVYERPVAQTFQVVGTNYASSEYHGYVDIVEARIGWDHQYLYASIDLWSDDLRIMNGDNEVVGMRSKYILRLGTNADGRNSYFFMADEPGFAAFPNTVFTSTKTEGFLDTDADVGGRGGPLHGQPGPSGANVTRTQNSLEEFGMNGYDAQIILSDGIFNGGQGPAVMWQRVSPVDPTVVEIAIDYVTLGLTQADLGNMRFVDFAAVQGGPSGPGAGLWNDKYFAIDAGSPNRGIGTDNEFGTQGLGSIYLADNVRGSINPPTLPCDSVDFNNDSLFPDTQDIDDFLTVFAGGPCPTAACGDIDFNNDGLFPDTQDIDSLLSVFSGGACL